MFKKLKYLGVGILSSLLIAGSVSAVLYYYPEQGGTGTNVIPTDSQILIGGPDGLYDVKTLTAGTNITISSTTNSLTITSSGGGSGGSNWQFTPGESAIRPTSTTGIIVSASSTFAGDLSVGTLSPSSPKPTMFVDSTNGRVGIGTSTPAYPFTIHSNLNAYIEEIIFKNGEYVISSDGFAAGFYMENSKVGADKGIQINDDGSIALGTIPKDNTLTGADFVIDTSNNIGIGTTTPSAKLQVEGPVRISPSSQGFQLYDGESERMHMYYSTPNNEVEINDGAGVSAGIRLVSATGRLQFHTSGLERLIILSNGNIGVSNTAPTSKMSINGGNLTVSTNGSATTTISSGVSYFSGGLVSQASSTITGDLTVGTSKLFVDADGNVGISTSTPTALFSVGGQAYTSATTTATGLVVRGNTATSTITIGTDTKPGCLKMQDTDLGGWSYFRSLNGAFVTSTDPCE